MPFSKIDFTKEMNRPLQRASLAIILDWCDHNESSRREKINVIRQVALFAKNNLINTRLVPSSWLHNQRDEIYYEVCETILKNVDLPDLLFLKHVINQINRLKNNETPLRDKALPDVQKNLDTLKDTVLPIVMELKSRMVKLEANKVSTIGIAFGCYFAIRLQFKAAAAVLASGVLLSETIVDYRIDKALENKLALKAADYIEPRMEDGYDNAIAKASSAAYATFQTASTFFNAASTMALPDKKMELKKPAL